MNILESITIDIPKSWLHGYPIEDYICCEYFGETAAGIVEGDKLLIRETLQADDNQTVAVMYRGCFMLGRVEFSDDDITFRPLNAEEEPLHITGEAMNGFSVVGVPEMLIRHFKTKPTRTPFLSQ